MKHSIFLVVSVTTFFRANIAMALDIPAVPVPQATVEQTQPKKGFTNATPFKLFEFNFNHPGARSTGMGGAFIGLADDATAAVTNPAGLTNIYADEVSFEVKYQRFQNPLPYSENLMSDARQNSPNFNPVDSEDSISNLSFLNYAKVTPFGNYSFFFRQPFSYELDYKSEAGTSVWYPRPDGKVGVNRFGFPEFDSSASADNLGIAGGWSFGSKREFRLGLNLEYSKADIELKSAGFEPIKNQPNGVTHPTAIGKPGALLEFAAIESSDSDLGFALGVLFEATDRMTLGATYRKGPEYELKTTGALNLSEGGFRNGDVLCFKGQEPKGIDDPRLVGQKCTGSLKTPDIFGVGFSLKANENLTFTGDLRHIKYSQLAENFDPFVATGVQRIFQGAYKADDVTEIHVGAEYVMSTKKGLLPLRAGYYYEPAHQVHIDEELVIGRLNDPSVRTSEDANGTIGREFVTWRDTGEDQHHFTLGFGFVPNDTIQFDFAFNYSEARQEALASIVKRF